MTQQLAGQMLLEADQVEISRQGFEPLAVDKKKSKGDDGQKDKCFYCGEKGHTEKIASRRIRKQSRITLAHICDMRASKRPTGRISSREISGSNGVGGDEIVSS